MIIVTFFKKNKKKIMDPPLPNWKLLKIPNNFLPLQMPEFATTHAMMATTRTILAATRAILALTWFCHLSMCL